MNAAQHMVAASSASEERMHKQSLQNKIRELELQVESDRHAYAAEVEHHKIEAKRELGLAAIELSKAVFERKSGLLEQWHNRMMSMIERQQTDLMQERRSLEEERFSAEGPRAAFIISRVQQISCDLVDLNKMSLLMNNQFMFVLRNI